MKHEGLYYAKHCATHGDYDDRAQVCPKCVPERGFPSPASPAVGGEEEAEAYADGCYSRMDEIDWARCRDAYLAGFSRGVEVEMEKHRMLPNWMLEKEIAALKQERDALAKQLEKAKALNLELELRLAGKAGNA